ncbi:MAG: MarR family transcriptional regulator [Acidobacteria bacterium]|nr:MarR family transcriptional regulator [Acidobacteriota bacterium]
MTGTLQAAIRQRRPFPSLEAEAFLNLQRSADALMRELAELLRPYDLSPTQYNVLRILRGAEPDGLPCGEVGARLVTRDPDVTRLLDRMQRRALLTKTRERGDRRVVCARISAGGLKLVNKLDRPIAEFHRRQLAHLGEKRLRTFIDLLEESRQEVT